MMIAIINNEQEEKGSFILMYHLLGYKDTFCTFFICVIINTPPVLFHSFKLLLLVVYLMKKYDNKSNKKITDN